MKIDRSKIKKTASETPPECKVLIETIKSCPQDLLLDRLRQIKTWTYGKCELFHWADVLDRFDEVLEKACKKENDQKWTLPCDVQGNEKGKEMLLQVLQFTAMLIEHSFSRHLYNSMEYLTMLLSSSDMLVVLAVLNLLYVFSKRSNFITRLSAEKKQGLVVRLTHLAESWGGKENGFGLAQCCQDLPITSFPASATTLHFEFYAENKKEEKGKKNVSNVLSCIHIDNVDKSCDLPSVLMEELLSAHNVPPDRQMLLFTHLRLAYCFSRYDCRVQCVQARLQAISILVYSNAIGENASSLLYSGLIEELVDILEIQNPKLIEIKAASLRTLTSIIHLDRHPKINQIIDATGASSYHGFLPVLVRNCIHHMIDPGLEPFPQPFATALFSFLYHLSSYESGGEALVSCGMMESLLKVINWFGDGQEHITFVTRAVRVVDLITNLDMTAFQSHSGLTAFINRLEHEIDICRKEQPFVIRPQPSDSSEILPLSPPPTTSDMETDADSAAVNQGASTSTAAQDKPVSGKAPVCFAQRAALLKSMLNFLKKAIPDPAISESVRHLMDGSLPRSLKHIISNAEYYGASLFLQATDVVTVYVFQEPSLLSFLQDNGLTDVVLHALLVKDQVPATREVLASLPNVFSALCLNNRGLQAFVECKPFSRLFKVLLSPDYLPAMRRRRSSDPLGDTASNLGNAMDELMRHQPSLRAEATKAIIKLLEEVCTMGRDPKYICQKPQTATKLDTAPASPSRTGASNDASSDEDEEEDEETGSQRAVSKSGDDAETNAEQQPSASGSQERIPVPLMDYVLNVMKFVEAILSNNTTDDHCREFVSQKGLEPLMSILGLPNLPIDFPVSPSSQAVASVCKAVLTLSHEPQVLKEGLLHLNNVLQQLEPLHSFVQPPGGSVLLQELAKAPNPAEAILSAQATPLLHALSATHAYIMMFVHVCKVGQNDIRSISVSHWGSQLGLKVLSGLSRLYTSLVWESTVLLALCSEDILPQGCDFGKADMDRLIPNDHKLDSDSRDDKSSPSTLTHSTGDIGSNGVSAAMETLSTSESHDPPMEIEESTRDSDSKKPEKGKNSPTMQAQMKLIKPLLSASSRLGRALAELFGLLVKLSVGSPVRQRRTQQLPTLPQVPTPAAREVASALAMLLASGLSWSPPPWSPVPKLRLTFLICSVGFTSPMLFDEKKFPYHLMLQKFMSSGGQDALFESFRWALSAGGKVPLSDGLEYPDLPDGTGEFLDAWLMLVEKMVNTKTVLESMHFLPAKPTAATGQANFVPFNPLQYLMYTHKAAFDAVMHLWGKKPLKVYGARMSDSILAILCHIIKGEVVIREKLAKEKKEEVPEKPAASPATTPAAPAPSGSAPAPAAAPVAAPAPATSSTPVVEDPTVNIQYMMQLTDMGFNQELVMEALVHTNNLEQATEYCLTHPPPLPAAMQVQSLPPAIQALNMDLDEDDEEDRELLQAIVMSLGDNVTSTGDQQGKTKKELAKKPTMEERERQRNEEPLDKQKLDCFTEDMIPGCMQLVDTLPESVYRVCDLIVVVSARNGESWRKQVLTKLMAEVADLCMQLRNSAALEDSGNVANLSSQPEATKLAARLHLTSLLFEEMKLPCAQEMEASGVLELLVHLLEITQKGLTMNKEAATPKWVAPILLLLDLYEKMAVASCRKASVFKLTAECHTWKWFDDRNGRWCNYSASNNKTIDDAYRDGETSVRFTAARRRYIVQFNTMVQVNEETGNRRPVMLSLTGRDDSAKKLEGHKEEKPQEDQANKEMSAKGAGVPMAEAGPSDKSTVRPDPAVIPGLMPDQITSLIRSLVAMIGLPVDQDTLHATLRLTLRLTREHQHAIQFAELGGCRLLLGLTQASAFQGFTSLAALILRHVLEDSTVLKDTMEKVVRAATGGIGSSLTGVAQGSMGSREMNYVLRVLAPAACREASIFKSVAKANLRVGLPTAPTNRDADEFEARLVSANTPQILQRLQSQAGSVPPTDGPAKEVLQDLLNALCAKYACDKDTSHGETTNSQESRQVQSLADALQEVVNEVTREISQSHSILRQDSAMSMPAQEDEAVPGVQTHSSVNSGTLETGGEENGSSSTQAVDPKVKEAEEKKKRPLLPKSMILRLLAELVRSYGGIAQMISQHTFQAGQSELVTQDCNVLAFILDQLLPPCQTAGDKDCAALSRVLLASIAACNHSPEAQATLVNELKGALQRALALPESTDKHARIQALTAIVTTVIESCPTPGQMPNQVFKGQQSIVNNMVRLLLKRGLVTDLARIPHSLDLSSPSIANTINAALKPLEMLSRIVNQPQTVPSLKNKSKVPAEVSQTEGVVDESAADRTPTAPAGEETNTEQMNINIDDQVRIEDVTETTYQDENDDTVPGGVAVEPDMDSQGQTEVLEDVIDELLQRDSTRNPEDQVIGEIIMRGSNDDEPAAGPGDSEVMIDVELEPGELVSADLQMTSQDISEDEAADHHDNDNNEHDDLSEADDADVDEDEPEDEDDHGDAEDEDVEEEDDEDDDDEGSDMEGDNDDFQDLEDALFGNQDDNGLFVQLEDIFSSGGQHVMFGGDSTAHIRTYQLPVAVHDGDNGNELAPPAVPPAPSNVMGSHPLLMRQPEPTLGGHVAARVHRVGRQRGTYRYNPGNQTFHVHYTIDGNRQPTPPAILQRLLGPTAAADVLQLTGNMSNGSGHARVLLANDELRFMQNDEDLFDDLMQENCYDGVGSSGILSSIPSALTRWTEEARVLDGDSIHDCITTLKPEIIDELEKQRDLELKERKEKRKKTSNGQGTAKEEKVETSKAAADSNKTEAVSTSQGSDQQRMEIGESSTTSSLNGSNTFSATSSGEAAPSDTAPVPVSEASRLASAIVEEVLSSTPITVVTSVHEVTPSAVSTSSAPVLETPHNPIPVTTPAAPVPNRYGTPPRCGQLYQLMMSSSTAGSAATTSGEQSEICPTLAMDISTDSSEQSTVVESSVVPSDTSDTPQGAPEEAPATPEEPTAPCLNLYRELVRARAVESQGSEEEQTGVITPEEPSNITSSDAVTVHTSGSEPPSTADAETPPNEQPPGFINENANSSWPPPPVSSSSSTASDTQASTSRGPSIQVATGTGIEVPEGVDPSFLAALPENIRQEVIAEQLRLERLQQRAQQQNQQAGQTGIMEVNPEFLAALPPNIQEEVLAQQRAEQARLSSTPTVPDTPVDPASFIASLPSSLRQQVLADMDDSMVAVLPADLAAEAQNLRRDMEDRHRRLMQDRLFAQAGLAGRLGTTYAIRSVHRTGGAPWGWGTQRTGQTASNANTVRIRGRYMLDNEALTCLLVLLFLDDPKLNTNRLHRVLRNLCYHTQTRTWVIRALLSILQRTGECKSVEHSDRPLPDVGASEKQRRKSSLPSSQGETSSIGATCRAGTDAVKSGQLPAWLSISLDAALGCRANVFQIQRSGGKKLASSTNGVVNIHPQASLVVCQHVLDILISLAKSFPSQFLPANKAKEAKCDESEKDSHKNKMKDAAVTTEPSASKVGHRCEKREGNSRPESDFWELLVRLDSVSSSKKGKGLQRTHSAPLSDCDGESSSFESSPIGQLMSMLSHPVVRRSQLLTDRLLRLLGLVSIGIPEVTQNSVSATSTSTTTTTSNPAASSYLSTTILASGVAPPARSETTAPDRQSTEQSAQEAPSADVNETMDVTPAAGETAPSDSQSTEQPAQEAWRADLNETMDISAVIDTQLATSTPVHKSEEVKTKEKEEKKEEEAPVLKTQLQLAVEVLTSKSCSEEGLEDATNLLLQLSRANTATRDAVLDLLLSGARELGLRVCAHISFLLEELKSLNARMPSTEEDLPDQDNLATTSQPKGLLQDRFNQGSTLVVSASSKERGRRELQLPSMSQLTGKSSSQQFLLRILKVIMQLREAARLAHKKELAKKPAAVPSFMAGRGQPLLVQGRNWRNAASIAQLATATPSVVPHEVPQPPAPPAASSQEPQPEAAPADSAPAVSAAGQTLAQALSLDTSHQDTAMELDQPGPSEGGDDKKSPDEAESELELPRLSEQLQLDELWTTLGECLSELARTSDHHAVLVLQPAVEAFFIVHAGEKEAKPKDGNQQRREDQLAHLNMDVMAPMSPQPSLTMMSSDVSVTSLTSLPPSLPPDTVKFLRFAETHRTVLNQILRQSSTPLVDGPFSVLVDHTRILDFDVKRRYFRQELERLDEGVRREELVVHVKRQHVFEDSFRELHRRSPDEWTHRFYIVFEGEEGQDAGGLLREWYLIISREIFNPNYALFCTSPGDRVTYTINPASHCNSNHLSYFRFVGRIIAKAIFDNKLLECYFTRSFYKHILGVPVKYHDMESEDYSFYQGLVYLLENNVKDLGYDLTFSTEIREFGITESRDLKPNGRNITVTEENKREYVKLVCQMKMTGAIRKQLNAFLEGFYDIIPKRLISIFNEQELELLISGLPTIDIDDLKSNTEYHKYQPGSLQVQWFWRALRSFDQADRARFLQFVTGTSKVPLQGFAHLEGMNGTQKFQIHRDDRCTDRLPAAHTCFNQLDLPAYETYDKLRHMLLLAINECSEGFGLA